MRLLAALLLAAACVTPPSRPAPSARYADLVSLFAEWRAFQRPALSGGVPDYTPPAMAAQHAALQRWMARLDAFDTRGWSVAEEDDLRLVRAEMNGLDFDHRVLRPWERMPAFYATVFDEQSDQPAREGPFAFGAVELWTLRSPEEAGRFLPQLQAIPGLLDQARKNLTGDARDLFVHGIGALKDQRRILAALEGKVAKDLEPAVHAALVATEGFIGWLEAEAPRKRGPSGVGVANYDWYLKNVQLLPYTWAEEKLLVERELARARAGLALEEEKNRGLPAQAPVASAEEHRRRFEAAVGEYVEFLRRRQIVTLRDWMEPALRARVGRYSPPPHEFFTEVDLRDPVMMRTHSYHWIDLAWMEHEPNPSPIRRGPLLYNIFDSRTEGFATAMEELMMHAGLFEARPRSRELIYILLAQRAARALGDLRMHANELTLDEAARFAAENTPRGWLRLSGSTVWGEQLLYLQQPAYGTSYVIGKLQVDELIAARARKLGPDFTLRRVLDELNTAGLVPISLVRRELEGG